MKIFKLITSLLVLGIIGLFFYQNQAAFLTPVTFSLDLYIQEKVQWSHFLRTLLLIAAGLGFVLGFLLMLKPYIKLRRLLAQERQQTAARAATTIQPQEPAPVEPKPEASPPPVEVREGAAGNEGASESH